MGDYRFLMVMAIPFHGVRETQDLPVIIAVNRASTVGGVCDGEHISQYELSQVARYHRCRIWFTGMVPRNILLISHIYFTIRTPSTIHI